MNGTFGNSAAIILVQEVSKNILSRTFFTKLSNYMYKIGISMCKWDLQNKY